MLDVLELDVDMPDLEVLEALVLLEDVLVLQVEVLDVELLKNLGLIYSNWMSTMSVEVLEVLEDMLV